MGKISSELALQSPMSSPFPPDNCFPSVYTRSSVLTEDELSLSGVGFPKGGSTVLGSHPHLGGEGLPSQPCLCSPVEYF